MADLRQLEEDRALRDAAKGLLDRDIAHLRGDVSAQNIGKRAAIRLREGAEGVGGDASAFVRENPGRVGSAAALGVGLVLLVAFRTQLSDWVGALWQASGLADGATDREALEESDESGDNSTN
ncbi:hypothetical protein [Erythrobacter sp. EC-HK427]|uniref:hypothetical protein n=1 Tax=Erythrobacter sp. EC-HK427 TaxID=2038396 RepID=UPI00125BA9E4|nr:hypothetical protein [Erythrobacter sp. EC-HK427]VVT15257.1 conserved hypothetical protein [Erythrobacter sp. EC-HK427]